MRSLPLVFHGVKELQGITITDLRAWKTDASGHWESIRVQVDQKNKQNEYVLEEGLPFTARSDDGIFDLNDEIVLMARDFGSCNIHHFKKAARELSRSWMVSARNPQSLAESCALVGVGKISGARPIDMLQIVNFDKQAARIFSRFYRYDFNQKDPILLGDISLYSTLGQTEKFLSSSEFVFNFMLPWFLPNFRLHRKNFQSEIESWQVGPLRAIIAVGVKFRQMFSLFDLHMFSELVFYESSFQIPTSLELKIDPSPYFRKGTGMAYGFDFTEGVSITHNLTPLDVTKSSQEMWQSGLRANASQYSIHAQKNEQKVQIRVVVDSRLADRSLPPMILEQKNHASSAAERKSINPAWDWFIKMPGHTKTFVDLSGLLGGDYYFGLDLVLSSKADENIIADMGLLRTTWSSLSSPKMDQ